MFEFDPLQRQKVISCFSNSAQTYQSGAQLQVKVGQACLERMTQKILAKRANTALDLGCGPGLFTQPLQGIADVVVSLDLSNAMLHRNIEANHLVQADSHQLPLRTGSIDLVFSSLMIQWCELDLVLAEIYRILKPGGTAIISTLVSGTLGELKNAWLAVDDDNHVHQYLTINDVMTSIETMNWSCSALEQEQHIFEFESVKDLARELKLLGANYVKDRKQKGLMSKSKWQKMERSYREQRSHHKSRDTIPATYNVAYIMLEK
jgi:malonyl-CoA O-methyltransferase